MLLAAPFALWLGYGLYRSQTTHRAFSVESRAMAPTLIIGDYVLAGPYAPGDEIRRGDIVFFRGGVAGNKRVSVLRVVGLPGDDVRVSGGMVMLNGAALTRDGPMSDGVSRFIEAIPAGNGADAMRRYPTLDAIEGGLLDEADSMRIAPGFLYVMGDNRDIARDSRSNFGLAPIENVIHLNGFIWYSFSGGLERWLAPLTPEDAQPAPQ